MKDLREKLIVSSLFLIYLLCSIRYFPDSFSKTLFETLLHILSIAPVVIGATLVIVSVLQKISGNRLPRGGIIRIYLVIGIFIELIVGLDHFFKGGYPQ